MTRKRRAGRRDAQTRNTRKEFIRIELVIAKKVIKKIPKKIKFRSM